MELTIFQHVDYRALLLMGGFLLLLLLFLYGYKKQQRRLKSGTEIARDAGKNENNLLVINLSFHVTRYGKWYRVCADFEFNSKEKTGVKITTRDVKGGLNPKKRILHPFALNLLDRDGRVVVKDSQTFHNFLGFSWSRHKETSYIIGAGSRSHHHGEGVPLLEFVPPRTGEYSVTFTMPLTETINEGTFAYESQFEYFVLSVREDVLPMQARAYPHKKIDLR